MNVWLIVGLVGAITIALKSLGPLVLSNRSLSNETTRVVTLLGPAVLSGLVATQTVGADRELVVDERLIGLAAGAVALRFRVPIVGVFAVAAVVTALARAL